MDSINKQQIEDNRDDLGARPAIIKMKELINNAKSCFFCTNNGIGPSAGVRPMSVQQVDDSGNIWFLSADDSYKNQEIRVDPAVRLFFQGSAHSDFLFVSGNATISTNKAKIDELWEPIIKTWFTGGKDDPRITVIQVVPEDGYYWDTKHGNAVAGIKMLIGAAIGKTLDDSIEGTLTL
ncbi:MAG: general stress protein [Chitinophagaceae bacterium]|nr:MAG: general stress protein [Chitinophagaceae bacterium]